MAIASCLVDTNILLRITRRSDPQHKLVDTALARIAGQGATLHYTHQNIAELWNTMTRPINRNGLGLGIADAEREVQVVEAGMSLLADTRKCTESGEKSLCNTTSGVQVHDARLAAAMYVHSVGNILTLNVADFSRFAGLSAIHPGTI